MLKFSATLTNGSVFDKLNTKIQNVSKSTMEEAAKNIAADTKTLISDAPELSSTVVAEFFPDGFRVKMGNGPEAAWHEFGTGNYAAIYLPSTPQWVRDWARQYFINGQGRTPAHPALYPCFKRHTQDIDKKMANKLR